MLYLGVSIFLAIVSLIIPPLPIVTVPLWALFTVIKVFTVLWGAMER